MGKIVGIDLGTTNSVVSVLSGAEPEVLVNQEGARTTPSVVAFDKEGKTLVGQVARRQAVTNPANTFSSVKRFIGKRFSEVRNLTDSVGYSVTAGDNDSIRLEGAGRTWAPEEISAKVLQKLKAAAEASLGEEVTDAVITVPAYFNDTQRTATQNAGKIAGLNVRRIINEPTAAALAYGVDKQDDHKVAVYDFGGGTFDISILDVGDGVVEVISTNGDTALGGDDVDEALVEFLLEEFTKANNQDVSGDKVVMQRLREASEKAKVELSSAFETEINLPFLYAKGAEPLHLNVTLTRSKFEQLISPIIERTLAPCRKALSDAKLKTSDVDEILLVGGSTRIPMVQEKVEAFFGKAPNRSVNPDEVVAMGAAVQAGILSGDVKNMVLLDVTPLSLGIETMGGISTVLIPRNTTVPAKKTEVFSTAADNQSSVEVVVLQGERKMSHDNRVLARFHLDGIPSAPRGVPQVEVTFDIDVNGVLHVAAKDKATSREQTVTVTDSTGLSDADIDKMVQDAEAHAEEDERQRKHAEARNQLDSLAYAAERTLNDNKAKLSEEVVAKVEGEIKNARSVLDMEDTAILEQATQSLNQVTAAMAEELYADSDQDAPANEDDGDAEVVDAEFTETENDN
ncbi:MAG: molecular chaperone DnaK [Myxococcales bacterium]|jgi:molecular chaperone DnaK|nr:molecular chaperone DnaK [Myxococcales bacterium]MBF94018.1 molecular chaperone DnaK [Myxococcales bacterium]|tara:strand:+ start:481 stop:2361 length:1881 start_codon:yes stop_codon:yes gene_type:complete